MNNTVQKNDKKGTIQLDNQAILLTVFMPSGRIQVLDKVSAVLWAMHPGKYSGSIQTVTEQGTHNYQIGQSGKNGIFFNENFYMTRNTETDDFHDITLKGTMGNDPDTHVTIRYLLSTTFPVLNCFCYVAGPKLSDISKLSFPMGLNIPHREGNQILLPETLQELKVDAINEQPDELWEPEKDKDHFVAGAPFFVMIRRGQGTKAAGCIGYMQHPLSTLEITNGSQGRVATPVSTEPDKTGISVDQPYHFRYQFIPSDDPKAISWLYREQLMHNMDRIVL